MLKRSGEEKKPVICQLLHSLNVGGAEILAFRIAKELQDRFHFIFACLDEIGPLGQALMEDGFKVELIRRKPGFDLQCARRLARFTRDERAEVIHAHQYTPFFYAQASGLLRSRAPILFTEHGRWFPDIRSWKRVCFNRLSLRKQDQVVGVGNCVKDALIENEGIPKSRVSVIYNGVQPDDFSSSTELRTQLRKELDIDDGEVLIIQVARLDALKDHPTAIRAFDRLNELRNDCKLLLVGEGDERSTIEDLIGQLRLSHKVKLLGARADIRELLCAADIFLLTSISEGIPVTLIEAMGTELPIVSTNVGGVSEVVVDEVTGLLTPAKDTDALAEKMDRLCRSPELRCQMGVLGRKRIAETFDQQTMHRRYSDLYYSMSSKIK